MISMIAALARNRVIGRNGGLPWRLPRDSAHFRRTTMGKPVIMGRRTFESMSDLLDGRRNIVVTGDLGFSAPGAEVARSLDEALELTADAEERVLIGGAAIYAAGLELTDRLYLTFIHADVEGDVLFPELDEKDWVEIERTEYAADERHEFAFSVVTLDRR